MHTSTGTPTNRHEAVGTHAVSETVDEVVGPVASATRARVQPATMHTGEDCTKIQARRGVTDPHNMHTTHKHTYPSAHAGPWEPTGKNAEPDGQKV